jgi:hypothetical protein
LVTFLPRHAAGWEILQGAEQGLVAADDFLLLPNPGPSGVEPAKLVFRVRKR